MKINKDLSQDIAGKHIIFVEDILDSGVTLSYLTKYLMTRQPASISIAFTLMDKPARRKADVKADYAGFIVPDALCRGLRTGLRRKIPQSALRGHSQAWRYIPEEPIECPEKDVID